MNQYNIDSQKIVVAHNGGNENFKPLIESKKLVIKGRVTNGEDYFVYVGALHARKNIKRLFEAYTKFKSETHSKTKLVIVGEEMWKSETQYDELNSEIKFTGHLPIEELIEVVAAAKALVLVSYFEGFGIPLVEAMRCGVPVIASNVTSLPEVVGDCGLLVDPFNVDDICSGLMKLDSDSKLHKEFSEKGLIRSELFSWQKSSEIIWNEINQILN